MIISKPIILFKRMIKEVLSLQMYIRADKTNRKFHEPSDRVLCISVNNIVPEITKFSRFIENISGN